MTNNLNEHVEHNQTNQTNQINEAVTENTQVPPSAINTDAPTPPLQKEKFSHKYPNLWKYITTGVLSFIAGMLVFSFASSLKPSRNHDRAPEIGQQMPMKSNKGQRQVPTHDQQAESTQSTQSTESKQSSQSTSTEKTI